MTAEHDHFAAHQTHDRFLLLQIENCDIGVRVLPEMAFLRQPQNSGRVVAGLLNKLFHGQGLQFHQRQSHGYDHVAGNSAAIRTDAVNDKGAVWPFGHCQANAGFRRIDFETYGRIRSQFTPVCHRPVSCREDHPSALFHVYMRPARANRFFKTLLRLFKSTHGQIGLGLQAFRHAVGAFGARPIHRRQIGFRTNRRICNQRRNRFFHLHHVRPLEPPCIAVDMSDVQCIAVGELHCFQEPFDIGSVLHRPTVKRDIRFVPVDQFDRPGGCLRGQWKMSAQ